MKKLDKILIIGPSWVGDMIMAQSLFMLLKQHNPEVQIDVLAPEWSLPLLARMPEVTKAIAQTLGHGEFGLVERWRIGRQLRQEKYAQAIVLPNSWKSALIPFFARIPVRTGFVGEARWGLLNDSRKLDKSVLKMAVQRFCALGMPKNEWQAPDVQHPKLETAKPRQDEVIHKFHLIPGGKVLVLCPGAEYGPSKKWPSEFFATVAMAKLQAGWQVWLLGSKNDTSEAHHINKLTHYQCRDFIGETELTEALDLMSLADTVVANDSGLMHMAAALDKKVIALYGSTSPEYAPPMCQKSKILHLHLSCSPCNARECPLYPVGDPSHTKCLTGITPQQVLELIPG